MVLECIPLLIIFFQWEIFDIKNIYLPMEIFDNKNIFTNENMFTNEKMTFLKTIEKI